MSRPVVGQIAKKCETGFRRYTKHSKNKAPRTAIKQALVQVAEAQSVQFVEALNSSVARQIQSVTVTVLHGRRHDVITVEDAIRYIETYSETAPSDAPASKCEIQVRDSNGAIVGGIFHERADAIEYLKKFTEPTVSPHLTDPSRRVVRRNNGR